jgi:hypothetical protein
MNNLPVFNLCGKLHQKYDIEQVSPNFRKRVFVLEVTPQHARQSEFIRFELKQDLVSYLDPFTKGDWLSVSFQVHGREVLNRPPPQYFVSLEATDLKPDLLGASR